MNTNKPVRHNRFWTSLVLSATIFVVLSAPAPLFAQTSEGNESATGKGGYSVDQVPHDASPCGECKKQLSKDKELINLLQEQNRRLKAENEKLKAGK